LAQMEDRDLEKRSAKRTSLPLPTKVKGPSQREGDKTNRIRGRKSYEPDNVTSVRSRESVHPLGKPEQEKKRVKIDLWGLGHVWGG